MEVSVKDASMSFLLSLAATAITLTLNAFYAVAPATITLLIRLEPDARNRALCASYESESTSGSSCWTVDGERAPKVVQRFYRDLPAGTYVVSAWVLHDDGSQKDATPQVVRITGLN